MCLAIPGEVLSAYDRDGIRWAEVRFGGVTREVCVHSHPDVKAGEYVLVHVGYAIARIDRDEAERAWAVLAELEAVS